MLIVLDDGKKYEKRRKIGETCESVLVTHYNLISYKAQPFKK